jgi:hypothetical protein
VAEFAKIAFSDTRMAPDWMADLLVSTISPFDGSCIS